MMIVRRFVVIIVVAADVTDVADVVMIIVPLLPFLCEILIIDNILAFWF